MWRILSNGKGRCVDQCPAFWISCRADDGKGRTRCEADADAFGDRGQEQNGNFSVDMVCCNKDCSGRTDRRATIMDDGNNCASQVHPPIFSLPLKAAAST